MEDENIDDVIEKAKNQRRQRLFEQRVGLLKAEDALKQLGGKDDYEQSLLAIVTAYPGGIPLSRVREFMPESKELEAAKETLKSKGLIEVGTDKRSPVLKPLKLVNNDKLNGEEPGEAQSQEPAAKNPTTKITKTKEESSKN